MDVRAHNREAWDRQVEKANVWTVPYDAAKITAARQGDWEIFLTDQRPVPRDWFPPLAGCDVLCLASGGGQQGPILAAAGARVRVLDNSPKQLAQDRAVADREGLALTTVEGDMRDLSMFPDAVFDLIFHPVSNCFVPDVRPVWREAFRVLRPGGVLLSGFLNPVGCTIDHTLADTQGIYQIKYALPYSDLTSLSEEERIQAFGADSPLEFGHTLEDQIGGQLDAGFLLAGLYEDRRRGDPLADLIPTYIATRALKPAGGDTRA